MNVEEVIALGKQIAAAIGQSRPSQETWDAANDGNDEASAVLREWYRIEDNAEAFLCEAAGWDYLPLAAARARDPHGREYLGPYDVWSLLIGTAATAFNATCDPNTNDDWLGMNKRRETRAERIARTFAEQVYLWLPPPEDGAWRACDREAALAVYDNVARRCTHTFRSYDDVLTDEQREAGRIALLLWDPHGRDERHRAAAHDR